MSIESVFSSLGSWFQSSGRATIYYLMTLHERCISFYKVLRLCLALLLISRLTIGMKKTFELKKKWSHNSRMPFVEKRTEKRLRRHELKDLLLMYVNNNNNDNKNKRMPY